MARVTSSILAALVLVALLAVPVSAGAQDKPLAVAWDLTRGVLVDPTTYLPAGISYEAHRRDWKTSQVFFVHGWMEANPDFTTTGLPYGPPVDYHAGLRTIGAEALGVLQLSVVNNLAAGIGERVLNARYPEHKKLVKWLMWTERIAFASYLTYLKSAGHFRQINRNQELARQYGY